MNRCEAGFSPRKLVAKSPQSVENSGIFSAPDFATGFCEALSLSPAYKTDFLRRFCGFTQQIDALKNRLCRGQQPPYTQEFRTHQIDYRRLLTVPATTQSANCRGAKAEFHLNFSGSFRDISAFCPAAMTPIPLRRNRIGTDLSDLFRSTPFTTSEERCGQRYLPIREQHVPCTQQEQPSHRSS